MTLSPLHKRVGYSTKKKTVSWRDRENAVTKLLNETSALIDVFYEVSVMLGPQLNLNPAPSYDPNANQIEQSKWKPLLSESCNSLHKTLLDFEPKHHLSSSNVLLIDL